MGVERLIRETVHGAVGHLGHGVEDQADAGLRSPAETTPTGWRRISGRFWNGTARTSSWREPSGCRL